MQKSDAGREQHASLSVNLRRFEDAARQMQGWDFEYSPDVLGDAVPWHYEQLASALVQQAGSVVDLGTGGGEAFERILGTSRCQAFATEEWAPNVLVASNHLDQKAVVTRCSSAVLPFCRDAFDVVLARHEAIDPAEVCRVLEPGGCFLSQQVINDFMFELGDYFSDTVTFPDFFMAYQKGFSDHGMQVVRAEEFRYKIRFRELGHLVYQLVAAPWTIPGFSVDTHLDGLAALNDQLKQHGELIFSAGYYLLEVRGGREEQKRND